MVLLAVAVGLLLLLAGVLRVVYGVRRRRSSRGRPVRLTAGQDGRPSSRDRDLGVVDGGGRLAIVVPGVGGTGLESSKGRAWVPWWMFLPKGVIKRHAEWKRRVAVIYDQATDDYVSKDRSIRPVPGARGINKLLSSKAPKKGRGIPPKSKGRWMSVEERLQLGYSYLLEKLVGANFRVEGHGYDFRRITGAECWSAWCDGLEQLILAESEPVSIYAHSFGGLMLHAFLVDRGARVWGRIASVVMIANPWRGARTALRTMLMGMRTGLLGPSGQQAWVQDVISNFSCILANLPTPATGESPDDPLVTWGERSWGYRDLVGLMYETGNVSSVEPYLRNVVPWLESHGLLGDRPLAGRALLSPECRLSSVVPVDGGRSGLDRSYKVVKRSSRNKYAKSGSFAAEYQLTQATTFADRGDGTVDAVSLRAWTELLDAAEADRVEFLELPGTDHATVVTENGRHLDHIVALGMPRAAGAG